ncbi:hypothetical protein DL98DRAFT_604561 [Cadophora sp. DSE1049]|nr:hypothetical protein DL98DRAFT_604561 [Cadophora sp. DSE1049]
MFLHTDWTASSNSPTAAHNLSLDAGWKTHDDEGQIIFPTYDVRYYGQVEDLKPPASLWIGDSYTASPSSNSTSTNVSPDPVEYADDTAVRTQPSRHIDYLSHNWKEEDIWSSWKHVVSKRKEYSNSARLENASWRAWTKSKNKLKTLSPESVNWLRDGDETWLYGPLQTGSDRSLRILSSLPPSSSRFAKSYSFLNKKPILKKRSLSEIMLQRSPLASSRLKQAAATVQAQQLREARRRCEGPGMGQATSDYVITGEKHIHFNEHVEQFLALEMTGDGDDDELDSNAAYDYDDSDSDDSVIMMKGHNSKRKFPLLSSRKATPRASLTTECKTIAMLPSTTLKYGESPPGPPEITMEHSNDFRNSGELSLSPSQKILVPSKPQTQDSVEDKLEHGDVYMDWQPPSEFSNLKDGIAVTQERSRGQHTSTSSSSLDGHPPGIRRTPSAMFIPFEEGEEDVVLEGLFGKVIEAVNTAKDIAYVIWNVGWR